MPEHQRTPLMRPIDDRDTRMARTNQASKADRTDQDAGQILSGGLITFDDELDNSSAAHKFRRSSMQWYGWTLIAPPAAIATAMAAMLLDVRHRAQSDNVMSIADHRSFPTPASPASANGTNGFAGTFICAARDFLPV